MKFVTQWYPEMRTQMKIAAKQWLAGFGIGCFLIGVSVLIIKAAKADPCVHQSHSCKLTPAATK